MNAAIERLRASKLEHDSDAMKRGTAAGEHWAAHRAEYPELTRIYEEDTSDIFSGNEYSAISAAHVVAFVALGTPSGEQDVRDANEFWAHVGADPEDLKNSEWLIGFVEGAALFYAKIADEL